MSQMQLTCLFYPVHFNMDYINIWLNCLEEKKIFSPSEYYFGNTDSFTSISQIF